MERNGARHERSRGRRRWRRARRVLWLSGGALLLVGFGSPTRTPLATSALPPGIEPRLGRNFTLLDATLTLPPLEVLAPELALLSRPLGEVAPPAAPAAPPSAVKWELDYRHAQLRDLSSSDLRNDPDTGFSRQLDSDILALGMSWRMAGNRVGLAYQLQSARGNLAGGLSRFLPGSDAATHALTLGVSREFGAGGPPPAPPPLLILEPAARDETLAAPTPSPPS